MEYYKMLFERDSDGASSYVNFEEDTLKLSTMIAFDDFGNLEYVVVRALKSLNADVDIDDPKFHTWSDEYFFYPKDNSCLRNNYWTIDFEHIYEELVEIYKACLDLIDIIHNPVVWYKPVWSEFDRKEGYKYRTNAGLCNPKIQHYVSTMDELFEECNARFGVGGFSVKTLDSNEENWKCELITDFYDQNPDFYTSYRSSDIEM